MAKRHLFWLVPVVLVVTLAFMGLVGMMFMRGSGSHEQAWLEGYSAGQLGAGEGAAVPRMPHYGFGGHSMGAPLLLLPVLGCGGLLLFLLPITMIARCFRHGTVKSKRWHPHAPRPPWWPGDAPDPKEEPTSEEPR